jgi:transposase
VIGQILESDRQQIRKQRHTSKRIHERLKQEHSYAGGYTVAKDYVRAQKLRQKEMFVPLSHPPSHAQVDFGEADILRNGKVERAHFFAMDLPHSEAAFVMAFPSETSEAFAEGHNHAFAYFGAVPQSIVYDFCSREQNDTSLTAERLRRTRKRARGSRSNCADPDCGWHKHRCNSMHPSTATKSEAESISAASRG